MEEQNKNITDIDIINVANTNSIEPALIKAISVVESNGSGFLPSGRCKILFEGHIFWKQLVINGINPNTYAFQNKDILYELWDRKKYIGGEGEYARLDKAKKIYNDCAIKSTSYGMFQIMGFNHKLCGYVDVKEFEISMQQSEVNHLRAVIKFLEKTNILPLLKAKNWIEFSKKYNGIKYYENKYDVKLATAYQKNLALNNAK